jgi:hypothetical protein
MDQYINNNDTPVIFLRDEISHSSNPAFIEARNQTQVIENRDSAMYKVYPQRCFFEVKQLYIRELGFMILPGMTCVIVLKDFIIVRYVFIGRTENEFLLKSADPEQFPDMHVKKSSIEEMWLVKSWTPEIKSEKLMY